ncbi:MAG: prevent-host-death protein [Epulopiscium sp. Nele67-Bin004]|nr:MAG: prevent-host-death protein [Epulopiscium sp. Nele67-Bin004]
MVNINVTSFRKNILELLKQTIKFNEPINISTTDGNVVVLSEEEYNGLIETVAINENPLLKQKIMEGASVPLEECVSEKEVEW